ncbi:formyltransferase family protein [Curvivirga sp.]|uniref:formyltransferase family protein n=1 Tax=Curvivirga sp. TaxID=2856848 RepID=UPI003B58C451
MTGNLILLTGEVEAQHFSALLKTYQPDLNILQAATKEELRDVVDGLSDEELSHTRLVAFCINVIVPRDILKKLPGPSYNFHPGPPSYPGSHSAIFAYHDRAYDYGVTFHEMTEKVDEGDIISIQNFGIASCDNPAEIEVRAFTNLAKLFDEMAEDIANVSTPIKRRTTAEWSGEKRGEAEALALMEAE